MKGKHTSQLNHTHTHTNKRVEEIKKNLQLTMVHKLPENRIFPMRIAAKALQKLPQSSTPHYLE